MGKFIDLTGQRFGRLTVISRAENSKDGRARWLAKCDCGNETVVSSTSLLKGSTKSCGCLVGQKHGATNSSTYELWCRIKSRCFNLNEPGYKNYGARGITMYPAWVDSFEAFYAYVSTLDHYNELGYTLDRIDNNGNYEPNNLRWADKFTQARNRRSNHFVEYKGEMITLAEAAELSGIKYNTLKNRARHGDTGEYLFRQPGKNRKNRLTNEDVIRLRDYWATGKYMQKELADMFGVSKATVSIILNYKHRIKT